MIRPVAVTTRSSFVTNIRAMPSAIIPTTTYIAACSKRGEVRAMMDAVSDSKALTTASK
jgi:hypothetical protein